MEEGWRDEGRSGQKAEKAEVEEEGELCLSFPPQRPGFNIRLVFIDTSPKRQNGLLAFNICVRGADLFSTQDLTESGPYQLSSRGEWSWMVRGNVARLQCFIAAIERLSPGAKKYKSWTSHSFHYSCSLLSTFHVLSAD
ncbi:hypothetical protein AOLI_G00192590 [Acnodon oligacanthus]